MVDPTDSEELLSLVVSTRRHLQRRERVGIRLLSKDHRRAERSASETAPDPSGRSESEGEIFLESSPVSEARSLDELREAIGDCRRCKLWSGRTHLVFGVGNPKANLMFVGEGP